MNDTELTDALRRKAIDRASASAQSLTKEGFKKAYYIAVEELKQQRRPHLVAFPVWGRMEYLQKDKSLFGSQLQFRTDPKSKKMLAISAERAKMAEDNDGLLTTVFSGALTYR